jgi:hypothetical protein
MKFSDLTHRSFGRWTVIRQDERRIIGNKSVITWLCRCECGNTKPLISADLTSGRSKSCGCFRKDFSTEMATTHGLSGTRAFSIWNGIKTRCFNEKCRNFPYYGGRGISMSKEWRASFTQFLDDMGEPPEGASIERKNNGGNYEKGNCVWATRRQQCRNRRSNRLLTFNGQTKCLQDWSETIGVNRSVIQKRLKRGWTVEESLQT